MKFTEKLADAIESSFSESNPELERKIKQNLLEVMNFSQCPFCGVMLMFYDDLYGCPECDFDLCSRENYQLYVADGLDTADEFVRDQTGIGGDEG